MRKYFAALLALLPGMAWAQAPLNTVTFPNYIVNAPFSQPLTGNEMIPLIQNGKTTKLPSNFLRSLIQPPLSTTVGDLATWGPNNGVVPTLVDTPPTSITPALLISTTLSTGTSGSVQNQSILYVTSATSGTKSISAPACSPAADGNIIGVVDHGSNAGANPIVVTPTAGTVGGGLASFVLNANGQSTMFRCYGAASDWAQTANVSITASIATNAALKATPTALYPNGIWRLGINAAGDAPPLFFRGRTGTCASNSQVSDVGACNDTTAGDGNSWQAIYPYPTQVLVTQFGVWADNNANDYSAPFQNAINYLCRTESGVRGFYGTGGQIIVPGGGGAMIALRSGVNTGCPGGIGGVSIIGESRQYTGLCACTGDTTVVTLNGTLSSLRNLSIYGSNAPGLTSGVLGPAITNLPTAGGTFAANHAALIIGPTANGYDISNIDVWGGFYSIWNQGPDGRTWYVGAHEGYGDANVRNSSASASAGGQWDQASIDQGTTGLPLPSPGVNLVAWAPSTLYSANTLVTVSYNGSTYVIEAQNGGTSGLSSPPVCNYLVACNDNGIHWFLVNQLNNAAIDDDGNSVDFYVSNADISGFSTYAILVTNRGGGAQPTFFKCITCTLGSFDSAIKIQEGNAVYIAYTIGGSFLGNAPGVGIDGTFTGTATFTSNNLSGYANAVTALAASPSALLFVGNVFTTTVTNNEILDNVGAGATFSFTDNVVNSASAGTVGIDLAGVAANGQIKNNSCISSILAVNCVQNNSSGAGNLISGNTGDGPDSNIAAIRVCHANINANSANTDNPVAFTLPRGVSNYRVQVVETSNPSISLTNATFGVFTSTGGMGTAIVASGTALSPLTTNAPNTSGSLFGPGINNQNTAMYNANPIYVRTQTAQGAPATFDICFNLNPLAQ